MQQQNQPEVMHCRGKIVASVVVIFLLPWHLQDIKQHKSANVQIYTNATTKDCTVHEPTSLIPITTAPFVLQKTTERCKVLNKI